MAADLPDVYLRKAVGHATAVEQLRSGLWIPVRRGAYAASAGGEPWQQRLHVARARAVAVGRQLADVTLSHESAALTHGLRLWWIPDTTHVIQRVNPRSGLPDDVRRHVCELDDTDVVDVDGLRVTSVLRTMLDCARSLHPRDALVVVDSGLETLVSPDRRESRQAIERRAAPVRAALLDRIAPRSRAAVQARAVVRAGDPLAESAPESVVRWLAVSRGMPRPLLQQPVTTARGTVYTDLAWLIEQDGQRRWLHVEYDGSGKYTDNAQSRDLAAVLLDERRREAAITDRGHGVLRVYPDEINDADRVYRKLVERFPPGVVASFVPVAGLYRPPRT